MASTSKRVPGLRAIPLARLLVAGEILLLARDHIAQLEPHERHRLVELLREGRGRRRNMTDREREELAALIAKAEPRLFLGEAAERLSPFPLPKRFVEGPAQRRR